MLEALNFRNTAAAGLAALIAVQAAHLAWAVAAPIGPLGAPPLPETQGATGADFAMLSRFDPFYRVPVSMNAAAPATQASGLRLFAVRSAGGDPSAIIAGPDGRQASVPVGAEVAPGVTLAAVASDHVVLSTAGRRSSLFFPESGAAGTGSMPYTPPPAPPSVQPASAPGLAQPTPELLAAAGLEPGDVVTSVSSQDEGELAVIQYERAGQVRTASLRIPSS